MVNQSPKYVPTSSFAVNEKFINYIMERGKKNVARRILNDAFREIQAKKKTEEGKVNPQEVFEKALSNATPLLEVRPKRVGGAVYQVPMEVTPKRQTALSMRWVLTAARSRKGKPMFQRLAEELMEAADGNGAAVKRKEDAHRMAEANRAFAHFAR